MKKMVLYYDCFICTAEWTLFLDLLILRLRFVATFVTLLQCLLCEVYMIRLDLCGNLVLRR